MVRLVAEHMQVPLHDSPFQMGLPIGSTIHLHQLPFETIGLKCHSLHAFKQTLCSPSITFHHS